MTALSFQLFITKIWAPLSKTSSSCLATKSCLSFFDPTDYSLPGSFCPWGFPGKNTGVGCHFLLQGIFPTQGSNPRLLHWQVIIYHCATTREVQDIPYFPNLHRMWLLITHFRVTSLDMAITVHHLMAAETSSRAFLLLLWFSAHQPLKCKSFCEMEYFLPYQ